MLRLQDYHNFSNSRPTAGRYSRVLSSYAASNCSERHFGFSLPSPI